MAPVWVLTAEKVPLRVILTARGAAGRSSEPRDDNPIVRLSRAMVKLTEAEQPARVTPPVRRFLRELSKLTEYAWLVPVLPRLENPATVQAAAREVRAHDAELDAILRTTISPTTVRAGARNYVIPNTAEAQVDVRRLLPETREEVLERIREMIGDNGIEVALASNARISWAFRISTALKSIGTRSRLRGNVSGGCPELMSLGSCTGRPIPCRSPMRAPTSRWRSKRWSTCRLR